MVQDTNLQIFLTIYHGQLLATFFYDYIIRNSIRLVYDRLEWNIVSNIALGILCIAVSIWAILSAWSKIRRNLLICLVFLIVIFIIRLAIGIPDMMDKRQYYGRRNYAIELGVFIAQIAVHVFGIVATWLLTKKSI